MRKGDARVDNFGRGAAFGLGTCPRGARADDAAFSQLADCPKSGSGAVCFFTIPVFAASGDTPAILAPGGTQRQRCEIFEQGVAGQLPATGDRLCGIDDIGNVGRTAQSAIAVDRRIERQFLADLQSLRKPVGGKGAIAELVDAFLAQRRHDLATLPRRKFDAAAQLAGADVIAIGNLVGSYQADIRRDRITQTEAVTRGQVDAFRIVERDCAGGAQFELVVQQPLRDTAFKQRRAVGRAITEPVVEVRKAEAEVGVLASQIELGLDRPAASIVGEAVVLPDASENAEVFGQQHAPIHADLAAAKLGPVLLAYAVIGIELAGVSEKVDILGLVLGFDKPTGGGVPFPAAYGDLAANFGGVSDPRAHIDSPDLGAGSVALVADDRRADADIAVIAAPIGADTGIEFRLAQAIRFVFHDNELRIEVFVAAENRARETDRAGQQVDVIVDKARQHLRRHDQLGTEAVARLNSHSLAVGENPAATELVRSGDALPLNFLALQATGNLCGKALRLDLPKPRLALHAGGGAIVACQPGLIETGLEITVERVKSRSLDADIELFAAGGIEPAERTVGENGVIGLRIDSPQHALVFALLGTVVSQGDEIFSEHPALGIKRDAGIVAEVAVEASGAFHVIGDRTRPDRTFYQADHRPFDIAGLDPCFHFLATRDLAVVENEIELQRPAHHGRSEFDESDAFGAGDGPARRTGRKAGELVELLAIELFGAFVRSAQLEIAGNPLAQGLVVAVENANGDHRPSASIGNQIGKLGYKLDPGRRGGEEDFAGKRLRRLAERIDYFSGQDGFLVEERDAAPGADGETAPLGIKRAVEGERIYRFAVDLEIDRLAAAVTHGDANSGSARIGIDTRRQETVFSVTQGNPIGVWCEAFRRAGCIRDRQEDTLLHQFVGACFQNRIGRDGFDRARACAFGSCFRELGDVLQDAFGDDRVEICDLETAALPDNEAGIRAAGIASATMAVDELRAFRQRHLRHLHDVRARHDAFEMIAAVGIGYRIAAVFHHHAHAGDARARIVQILEPGTWTGRDAPDDGQAVGDGFAFDVDCGACPRSTAERIDRERIVQRTARCCIGAHGHGIGYPAGCTAGNIAQRDRQHAAIGRDGDAVGGLLAVDADRVGAKPQLRRWRVGQDDRALHPARVGIASRNRVEHDIAGHHALARCRLGQTDLEAGPVERDVDLYRYGSIECERRTIRRIADEEAAAIGTRKPCEIFGRYSRRSGIGLGRHDLDAIASEEGQREPVLARPQFNDIAGAIGYGLAGYDRRRPRGHAIFGKYRCRQSGDIVNQRHASTIDGLACFTVENHAERIGQHVNGGAGDRCVTAGRESGDFDGAAVGKAEAAIVASWCGCNTNRSDPPDKYTGIRPRLVNGLLFAIAAGRGYYDIESIDRCRIAVRRSRDDIEEQRLADADDTGLVSLQLISAVPSAARVRIPGKRPLLARSGADRRLEIEIEASPRNGTERPDLGSRCSNIERHRVGRRFPFPASELPACGCGVGNGPGRFCHDLCEYPLREQDQRQQYCEEYCCHLPERGGGTQRFASGVVS